MNAPEIVRELAAELEIYKLLAYTLGLKTKEDVENAVKAKLDESADDE